MEKKTLNKMNKILTGVADALNSIKDDKDRQIMFGAVIESIIRNTSIPSGTKVACIERTKFNVMMEHTRDLEMGDIEKNLKEIKP